MNQAIARATRRDLRRAVGADALDTIARQSQTIGVVGQTVQRLHARLITLETKQRVDDAHTARWLASSVWARLHFLLMGRWRG